MSCKIECEWLQSKRILVNPDGQVWPCCYLANSTYMRAALGYPESYTSKETYRIENQIINLEDAAVRTGQQVLLKEYFGEKEQYNIFNHTIDEIVESKWFAETLPKSWDEPERVLYQCKINCSKSET